MIIFLLCKMVQMNPVSCHEDGTAVISVVVLQNRMDLLNSELGPCSETRVMSSHEGNGSPGINVERVTDMTEEEDQERTTIPVIKTEPNVSSMAVLIVRTFHIGYLQNCLPLYQSVLVQQKCDSREWSVSQQFFRKENFIL
jgi:hypothetical protein